MIITENIRPQLWIIAGVNGAGKTTFTNKYLRGKIAIINPDEIAIQKNITPLQAGKKAILERQNYLEKKISFAVETTLSGFNEIELIKKCKDLNYKINLVYIYLQNKILSYSRVQQRVQNYGHNIPINDINRRYQKSINNFIKITPIIDRIYLLDNSDTKTKLVSSFYEGNIKFISKNISPKLKEILSNIN